MTTRLSTSSLAGTARTLVAVGTARLASMLVTVRAAAPFSGRPPGVVGADGCAAGLGAGAWVGAGGAAGASTFTGAGCGSAAAGASVRALPLPPAS